MHYFKNYSTFYIIYLYVLGKASTPKPFRVIITIFSRRERADLAFGFQPNAAGYRFYVVGSYNYRVQYFRDTTSGVTPASLGRVKAVFR
jgi:hypothetical protein